MSLVSNIEQQIKEWKNESKGHNDYWIRVSNYLAEFQSLTNLVLYISDDSENYYDIDCYKELLENIKEIIEPEMAMSSVTATIETYFWTYRFQLNDQAIKIEMEDPNTDWLQADFLKDLNANIRRLGVEKQLKMVWATSENNTDQCFDLAFMTDEIFEKLLNHSPKYAHENV